MNKSVKKFLTQISAVALLCTGAMSISIFNASEAGISERERASQIQQSEFQKYHSYEWNLLKSKIECCKEEINILKKSCREELDSELACLLQVEEDLKAGLSNCSWWSWESWNLNSQLSSVRIKISSVRSKISANNDRIRYLEKMVEALDSEYAVILQNQEISKVCY